MPNFETVAGASPRFSTALCAAWISLLALLGGLWLPGCAAVPVTASNPIPGLTTVAVVPFYNLSAEPSVDGRRFALAYFSELQKTPGFQVVPVGVVEQEIQENQLSMSSPADVIRLAQILNVDAVVVGAVTDYSAYYPPQVGFQINWYSPRDWAFYPGIQGGECRPGEGPCPDPSAIRGAPSKAIVRGQSAGDADEDGGYTGSVANQNSVQIAQSARGGSGQGAAGIPAGPWPGRTRHVSTPVRNIARTSDGLSHDLFVQNAIPQAASPQPLMSYTRFFDGADPKVISALRDYYAYRGDLRSGGWEAYLHRSEDFIRFTMHLTIVEMLSLHGGTLQTEYIFKYWK